MALGSKAKRAVTWTAGALAGAGLLVGSFFAGTAVGENDALDQAGATSRQEDAREHTEDHGWELFDQDRDSQDQDARDGQDQDAEDRDGQDRDAEDQRGPDDSRDGRHGGHPEHRDHRHGGHPEGDSPDRS